MGFTDQLLRGCLIFVDLCVAIIIPQSPEGLKFALVHDRVYILRFGLLRRILLDVALLGGILLFEFIGVRL